MSFVFCVFVFWCAGGWEEGERHPGEIAPPPSRFLVFVGGGGARLDETTANTCAFLYFGACGGAKRGGAERLRSA